MRTRTKGLAISAAALCGIFVVAMFASGATSQGLTAKLGIKMELTVKLGVPNATEADWHLVTPTWLGGEGWSASCYWNCHGITYTKDPTVYVVNQGLDQLGCLIGDAGYTVSCTQSHYVEYIAASSSSGSPAYTDTSCPATVLTTDGYSIATASYTAGDPSAGSVIDQWAYTWTAATSASTSAMSCLLYTNSASSLWAEGQTGSTTTNPGDTLEDIWQVTISG
jgi:hypothetical protein